MSKQKQNPSSDRSRNRPRGPQREARPAAAGRSGESGGSSWASAAAVREIVESIVIAFVLAFLFRTFEAEAFVIPTGSMAPTLMGRHKDLTCSQCGFPFQASASVEMKQETDSNEPSGLKVVACTCPNCRFTMDLSAENPQGQTYRSYKGDRILVAKFPYEFADPQRWDVAVFKFPGGARTNYIKRVVGLPGEWVRIRGGDVFVQPRIDGVDHPDEAAWTIARKPPRKIRAMLQTVYDNDYGLPELLQKGWPPRWTPEAPERRGAWVPSADHQSFQTDGSAPWDVFIGYRHVVPSYYDWQRIQQGSLPPGFAPRAQLITDFNAYNTEQTGESASVSLAPEPHQLGLHWVGDLAVEATVHLEGDSGYLLLELVEGGRRFGCRIDVATGEAVLDISGPGMEDYRPVGATPIRAGGSYSVLLANVDDQLTLWVDGKVVRFDQDTAYPPLENTLPTDADLEPARIGSRGARLRVDHLRLYRDIYYIAKKFDRGIAQAPQNHSIRITDYDDQTVAELTGYWHSELDKPLRITRLCDLLSHVAEWRRIARRRRSVQFAIPEDQFFMLGDNSAESQDSRLWVTKRMNNGRYPDAFVRRELLIGKALVIYWPHSLDRIPYLNIPIRFFPNFRRMWVVR